MAEFRDSTEASESDEEKSSLLEKGWQAGEHDSIAAKNLADRQGFFEGASSMLDLPNQSTATDENLPAALEQNLRKLLKDVEKSDRRAKRYRKKSLSLIRPTSIASSTGPAPCMGNRTSGLAWRSCMRPID